jgi:hypothetical protein
VQALADESESGIGLVLDDEDPQRVSHA